MPSKSSKSKTNPKPEKIDRQAHQTRWMRIAFGIFAVLLILSMVLAAVSKY
jgi:hypothetical protein